jgi:hypothetical protein
MGRKGKLYTLVALEVLTAATVRTVIHMQNFRQYISLVASDHLNRCSQDQQNMHPSAYIL